MKRIHRQLHMLDRRVKRKIVQIPQSKTRDWKSKIREERIMTYEDSAVLLGGLVSLKNTSSVVLAVLI
jgi:hypothetical protein